MNDGQNAAIFWLLARVSGCGEVGVENRVCYFKCNSAQVAETLKNSSEKYPLEFPVFFLSLTAVSGFHYFVDYATKGLFL